MENESDFNEMVLSPSSSSGPSPSKLKRLKKMTTHVSLSPSKSNPHLEADYSDGLDPLFSDGAKRVLEFTGPEYDADYLFNKDMGILELQQQVIGSVKEKNKMKRKRSSAVKPKSSKRKEDGERKAHLAQQADFQRVMRERKSVGFKPLPMVEKPISSVLEKIRQRKLEVSKKMGSRSVPMSDVKHEDFTPNNNSIANSSKSEAYVMEISEDKPCSSDEQTPSINILLEETEKSFRAPVNDTQDLFSEFQASESQEYSSNEVSGSPVKDVSPSLTSLNLRLDSALPDVISSDEEESDKENTDPLPKSLSKHNFSSAGDPLKAFLDEEALEDDSDDDLLHSEDKEEENDTDVGELCDYIATDFKEKSIDSERRDQLHRTWLQQQDAAGTENLLQKLKYGGKQQEPTFLEVEVEDDEENEDKDDDGQEDEEDDTDDDTENFIQKSARFTTRMLKQMIPQMFTDEDDGYVSSEDEVMERSLSKEHKLHKKKKPEKKTEFLTVAKDEISKEVFGRIRKLNSVPETKKKAKTPSFFDVMLTKGSGSNSIKSSFLRRASSHPVPTSNHKKGPSTGRSFIFGRDDSRSSAPITAPIAEDSAALIQSVSQVKKVVAAKFRGSQVKWSTQETQTRDDKVHKTSLFEILKRSSSVQTIHNNTVDQQAVFAAFKSVKKQIRVDGRL